MDVLGYKIQVFLFINLVLLNDIIQYDASGKYLIRLKKKDFKKKAPLIRMFLVGSYRSDLKYHIANQE